MTALFTSEVCSRECEKDPLLVAESTPCSEDVEALRMYVESVGGKLGVISLPYREGDLLKVLVRPAAYAPWIETELSFSADDQ